MHMPGSYDVFLSAVSPELGPYRAKVAAVLRRKGLHVCEQQDFSQGEDTLIRRLAEYIEHCEAVVLLVGERCGGMPTAEHAASLDGIARPELENYQAHSGQSALSYTQWEYLLAKHYGRPTYVYLTAAGFVPTAPNPEDAPARQRQQAYRAWLRHRGEHTELLTTEAQLVEDVLVQPFPDLTEKPRKLPYGTLGTLFMGREPLMRGLRAALSQPPTAGRPAAAALTTAAAATMHGLGGIGKTRAAVEYAHRYGHEHTALLFVAADSPEKLNESLAELWGYLPLPQLAEATQQRQIAGVLAWLRQNPGWLLVLDNVDNEPAAEAADELLSQLQAAGQFIITSRLRSWSGEITALELGVLPEPDAVAFLLARTESKRTKTPDEAEAARRLVRKLGGLALALEQAAAYIGANGLALPEYEQAWETSHQEVLAWERKRVTHYHSSVATTWLTSFQHLRPAARTLLNRLAWLAPAPIPKSLLLVAVPGAPPLNERTALEDLANYSLVTFSQDRAAFTVHRLVQDVARQRLADEQTAPACLTEALNWICKAFEGSPQDVHTWPVLDPLLPHALAVTAPEYTKLIGDAEPTSRLLNNAGVLLNIKGEWHEAEPLMRRALAIDETSLGPNHPIVANRLNNLAQSLQATNCLTEAESLMRRALTIDETNFGPNNPDVARNLSNLGSLLRATNRLPEAELLMRRALAIDETNFGPHHPDVATDLNNLALLLKATDRLPEAEQFMRRALAIDETSFGPHHPTVAIALNNLAQLLQATNRFPEAEPLMQRVIGILEESLGKKHPQVATALNNLAQLLQATDRLPEAELLMGRALAIDEASFGSDHPDVAIDLNNLARLFQATGRLAEAKPLMRRALLIFFRSLDWEHPNTQTVGYSYITLLLEMGHTQEQAVASIQALLSGKGD